MDGKLQRVLDEALEKVPRHLLENFIKRKLKAAGIPRKKGLVAAIADHVVAGESDEFSWGDDGDGDESITIQITDADLAEFDETAQVFIKDELPKIVTKTTKSAAEGLLKTLKKNWPEQHAWQKDVHDGFRTRLEERWGAAFDLLRMLHTISVEIGGENHSGLKRSKAKRGRIRRDVLLRLHARACQITGEIITLMENGFADGAMARWRTLYEVGVVATLIAEHEEDLAERYLAHEVVEAKSAQDRYIECCDELGYKPPTKAEIKLVTAQHDAVLAEYGPAFGRSYGWAAHHLGMKDPKWNHLEAAAGRSKMRSHYKMASYNVHAGTKGITYKLGLINQGTTLLAGASNAGFQEPGQNTVIALSQITFLLFGPRYSFDDNIQMQTIWALHSEAVDAFVGAGATLKAEEGARKKKGKR